MSLPLYTGPGTNALFLHGFLGSGADWTGLAGDLPFRLLVPDLPGHGAAVGLPQELYSMEGAAEFMLCMLDGRGVETCNIVGYSMGGRLALYLALRHPERVKALVLESSSPGLKTEKERAARRKSDKRLADRLEASDREDLRCFLEGWHRQLLFASLADHEGLTEKLVAERLSNDPRELARSLRSMGTGSQPSLWDELPDLRVPTLAVAGELDGKFRGIAREMARLSENIEIVVVEGAGHNVHVEKPQEFARLVGSFSRED
ncbi:2-succinyl-6-hydroxy-2,4-cyclohexadiene-1-carboxylate synthase [Rubrobacter indicoceani]|uniref:2-succinyl-6-hydroxy-2, 4-cyclohexadiene-1-carboxylate synthase n=1 Tax=Rubrobacter indicoceani TaxID=2051957 RepID=UPI000E5AB905|nr:2-succinyl-6-hydroxy-2,4-cyclohexadiene-1-carboxylate synthase [Rubrobacter indicoceani]